MNTNEYFQQAELSLAAYGTFESGTIKPADLTKDSVGMAAAQATHFADTYNVLAQYNDTAAEGGADSGLSVTIFQNKQTGEKYLAIRGTQDGKDLLTDLKDVLLLGSTSLQAQYASLKQKVEEWTQPGGLLAGGSFTVTGHSLGGFLAAGLTGDFADRISHAYLYNAPGFGGIIGTFLSTLGVTSPPDSTRISNLKAEAGPSLIAGLGVQIAKPIPVEIEDQTAAGISNPPAALNHSQQVLTDALAAQAAFARLDASQQLRSTGKNGQKRNAADRFRNGLRNRMPANESQPRQAA